MDIALPYVLAALGGILTAVFLAVALIRRR